MKFVRVFALFLALLMLLGSLVACHVEIEIRPDPTPSTGSAGDPGDKPVPGTVLTDAPAVEPEPSVKPEGGEDDVQVLQDTVPADLKYNGEPVTFLVRDGSNMNRYELACESLINDPVYDSIHYRNMDVENRLGVRIRTVYCRDEFPYTNWNNTLATAVLVNTGDFDGAAFYLSAGTSLAKEGIYYNLLSLTKEEDGYLDFEKPWWNSSMVDELSVYGAMFFAGGSLTLSQAAGSVCVFFNRDLFNRKYPGDRDSTLYRLVRDGRWTADKMTQYVSNCWDDLNSDGIVSSGDVVGIKSLGNAAGQMDAWVLAMGIDFTKPDAYGEPELAILSSHTVSAYERVRGIFNNLGGYIPAAQESHEETSMPSGNVLFYTQCLGYGADLRSSSVDYGILPIPKYNESQTEYRTGFANSASALAVCSNLDDARAAMVSAVLEVLSAESYKQVLPAYYETVLKGHYSREQADAEMYDLILGSFVFSFGFAYSTHNLGAIGSIFRDLSPTFDMQNHIDSNKETWNMKLSELLSALEAVS